MSDTPSPGISTSRQRAAQSAIDQAADLLTRRSRRDHRRRHQSRWRQDTTEYEADSRETASRTYG